MVVHIDWLSVSQVHVDSPEWGSIRRCDFDVLTGELESDRILGDSVQASWDTSVRVRSMGGRVEVSGNPSKWGRLDAITGLPDVWQCLDVYNGILRELGLPEFRRAAPWHEIERGGAGGDRHDDGPRISRVDLTDNLICGRNGVRGWLDWLEAQVWGDRLPFERTSSTMVAAGRRKRRQLVSYDKAAEILANIKKWKRSRALEKQDAVFYLSALVAWAREVGLVRREVRLGSQWLSERVYCHAEAWGPDTVAKLFSEMTEMKTMNAGALSDYGDGVYQRLLDAGCTERMAGACSSRVSLWLGGQDWRVGLTQATAYRYAKLVRDNCGLELRKPSNIRSLATCVKPKVLEARPLSAADLPDWYQYPQERAA